MKYILIISFFFSMILTKVHAQGDYAECRKVLKEYVKKISLVNYPSGTQVYYMDMDIAYKIRNTENPELKMHVEVLMSKDQLSYNSNYVSVFQDEKDAFMVLHAQKTILRSKGGKSEDRELNKSRLTIFQDTIIDLSKIKQCTNIKQEGKDVMMIELEPNEYAKKTYFVKSLKFYYDPIEKALKKISIFYTDEYKMEECTVSYNKVNYNYKGWSSRSAYDKVLSKTGQPVAKFKNYKIVDNTKHE